MDKIISLIIEYIKLVYKPNDVDTHITMQNDEKKMNIFVWFNKIDDSYLKNPYAVSPKENKERHLERAIRKDVESFFGVKTSGVDPSTGFAPYQSHNLNIFVMSREVE